MARHGAATAAVLGVIIVVCGLGLFWLGIFIGHRFEPATPTFPTHCVLTVDKTGETICR